MVFLLHKRIEFEAKKKLKKKTLEIKNEEEEEEDVQRCIRIIIFTLWDTRVNLENLGYICCFASVLG